MKRQNLAEQWPSNLDLDSKSISPFSEKQVKTWKRAAFRTFKN